VSPYEYAVALAQNAVKNGVDIKLSEEVTGIDVLDSGRNEDGGDEELQRTVNRVLDDLESVPLNSAGSSSASFASPRNFLVETNGGLEGGGSQYTASIVINCGEQSISFQ
jgi:phytoene dehydrogenase-like protein